VYSWNSRIEPRVAASDSRAWVGIAEGECLNLRFGASSLEAPVGVESTGWSNRVSVDEDGITKIFIASTDTTLNYFQVTTHDFPIYVLRDTHYAPRGFENIILETPS
jgi:hypothetical protein